MKMTVFLGINQTIKGVQSQMTNDPDNRRPRWPNFKQTEEVYQNNGIFLILQNSIYLPNSLLQR